MRFIDFLHKTAKEFLKIKTTQKLLIKYKKNFFDVNMTLCRVFLVKIKSLNFEADYQSFFESLISHLLRYARRFELERDEALVIILDELDKASLEFYQQLRDARYVFFISTSAIWKTGPGSSLGSYRET